MTIVSGLARGIDAAAHRGALEAGGLTVGVIGNGLDLCYPKEHRRLAEDVAASGALISEFPLGTPPLSQNFPYRNRVLSGLCFGVLVVEAAEHSGSLITARLAAEQGREIFAVPGNITSRNSFGPNYLIKDGAKLVQLWRDIVEELPREQRAGLTAVDSPPAGPRQPALEAVETTEAERLVLKLLTPDEPIHIDQLRALAGLESPALMAALLQLEMKDRIRQLPGKCFVSKL
jgi:DNA processing protein